MAFLVAFTIQLKTKQQHAGMKGQVASSPTAAHILIARPLAQVKQADVSL